MTTPSKARATFTGPDVLTLSRVPLAIAIPAVALGAAAHARPVLVALFVVAIATDVIDGWWARRLGLASNRGAALDSLADAALSACVAVAVALTVQWSVAPWAWWAVGAVLAIRVASLCVTFGRFRVFSIAHTWANKASGIAIAAAALWALGSGHLGAPAVAIAVAVAALAAAEELAITATRRDYLRDRRGWWDDAPTRGSEPRRDGRGSEG